MFQRFHTLIGLLGLALGPLAWAGDVTVEEDLAPLVKTLSRPVDVYHWAARERAKFATYTRRRIEEGGLITATDPVSTRPRDGEAVLFRYTLPKGFRFIDVRASEQAALSSRAADRLKARGCAVTSLARLFAADASLACRKIAADSVKILQIDAVVVIGPAAHFEICPKRAGAAFVIFDGTRFLPEGAALLTTEAAHPEQLLTRRAYVESSIFGCGTAEEDRFPDAESALAIDFEQIQRRFESVSKALGKALEPLHPRERMVDLSTAELRKEPYYEKAVRRDSAPDAEGVDSIQFFKFRGETGFGLQWVDLKCQEELPDAIPLPGDNPECRKIADQVTKLADTDAFWAETRADFKAGRFKDRWYWHACWPRAEVARRQTRFCGMIAYPEPETIDRRVKAIMKRVSDAFSVAGQERSESPLRLALTTERELAALRPFARDNSTVSQKIINSITDRAELPPIRSWPELFTPEERWIQLGLQSASDSVRDFRARLRELEGTTPGAN